MPILGLMGPLSAVPGPISGKCGCRIVAARPACSSRWDAAMGQRLCDPLHDPRGSLHADYQPRGTVFGGAAQVAKPVKSMSKWRKVPCERMVSFCSDGSDAVCPSKRPLWQPACPFLASWDHFRQCQGPAPAGAVAVSLVCPASRPPPLEWCSGPEAWRSSLDDPSGAWHIKKCCAPGGGPVRSKNSLRKKSLFVISRL